MTNNGFTPKQAKAGFILAIEKLEQVDGDWDWMLTSTSPVAKLNRWLTENPNFRLAETPRIESRLLSRQIEHGKDVMTFSISVSYLYEDISERTYDSRHTSIFERATEPRSTKEERHEDQEEKEKEIRAKSSHDTEPRVDATATATSGAGAKPSYIATATDRADYPRPVESTDGASSAAASSGGSARAAAAAGQAVGAKHKFASAADAISFLADHGFAVPESAVRTIVGITNRDVSGNNKRRVEKTN